MAAQEKPEFMDNDGNEVLEGDGFYVSYNPAPWSGIRVFQSDEGASETALYDYKTWRILNGDFRKEYLIAVPKGWEAALAVYEQHKAKHRSSWSSGEQEG